MQILSVVLLFCQSSLYAHFTLAARADGDGAHLRRIRVRLQILSAEFYHSLFSVFCFCYSISPSLRVELSLFAPFSVTIRPFYGMDVGALRYLVQSVFMLQLICLRTNCRIRKHRYAAIGLYVGNWTCGVLSPHKGEI